MRHGHVWKPRQGRAAPFTNRAIRDSLKSPRFWRWAPGVLAVLLGIVQAFAHRHQMNADGISYLDLGDAWMHGDWSHVINGYWSPLYPILLGITARVIPHSMYWDATMAHTVNVAILVGAVCAFDLLIGELTLLRHAELEDPPLPAFPDWIWKAFAWIVFLWTSLFLIGTVMVTPDLLVSAMAYLAAALALRARRTGTPRDYLILGVTLGVGFLAKSAMLPLAIVWLVLVKLRILFARASSWRPLWAMGVSFLAVIAPLIIALSVSKHRLTFGDSGRINYGFFVDGVKGIAHWRGAPEGSGTPMHTTRQVFGLPDVYEFATPVGGTYPVWYDPSYWFEGLTPHVVVAAHVRNLELYGKAYWKLLWPFTLPLLAGLLLGTAPAAFVRSLGRRDVLLLPGAAALLMYALVYAEERYIGGFFALVAVGVVSSMRARPALWSQLALAASVAVASGFALEQTKDRSEADLYDTYYILTGFAPDVNPHWLIAEKLLGAGIAPGTRIGVIGGGARAYWARLARFRIVSEIPDRQVPTYWDLGPARQMQALRAMKATGARFVVTDEPPAGYWTGGWSTVGIGGKMARPLPALVPGEPVYRDLPNVWSAPRTPQSAGSGQRPSTPATDTVPGGRARK